MSKVGIGSYWRRKSDQRMCRVLHRAPSMGARPGTILTLVYTPDYMPSILPSTIFESDFLANYEFASTTQPKRGEKMNEVSLGNKYVTAHIVVSTSPTGTIETMLYPTEADAERAAERKRVHAPRLFVQVHKIQQALPEEASE